MNIALIKEYLSKQKIKVVSKYDFEKKEVKYDEKIKGWKVEKFNGDEEIVRAYLLAKLVNELGYSNISNLEIEKTYTIRGGHNTLIPRIDLLVKDSHGNPFLFIEIKAPDKFESDKNDIEGQLFELADQEEKKHKTKVSHLVYYTIEITTSNISDNFILIDRSKIKSYDDWEKKGYISHASELPKNYGNVEKKLLVKNDLKALDKDNLSKIRTKIHNTLWSAGVEDNEAYLFLVKYLLTKIYDEQNTKPNDELVCQIHDSDINNEKDFLDRINNRYFDALREKLTYNDGDLEATGKILNQEKIPIKSLYFIVKELEKFSFSESLKQQKEDILGSFFEETNREKFKQDKGQFFTHTNIVKFLIYALQLDKLALSLFENEKRLPYVIDPSTGSGTFLIELMKVITMLFNSLDSTEFTDTELSTFNKLFPVGRPHQWAEKYLYGIDNSYSLAISTKVNMILHGDGSSKIIKNDGIVNFQAYRNLDSSLLAKYKKADTNLYGNNNENSNFLIAEHFDAILSNPPFSVNPIEDERERAKHFLFGDKKNSENLFIERWYQLLKPKGRIGVVLPESVFDTTENKYIRLFIYKYFNVKAVVSLPQLTFEPYTSTKTSLLFAQKKNEDEIKKWNESWKKYSNEWSKLARRVKNYSKVFDGEDEKRFTSINKDLKAAIAKAKGDEKELKKITALLLKILKRNKDEKETEGIDEDKLKSYDADKLLELFESEIKEIQFLQNTKRLLKDYITPEDDELSTKDLTLKYLDEIDELCSFDKDTKDVFGFVNTWWVFGEVAKELNYKIFMAEVENIGYKRTKRGEKPMPNDLYDLEIAPTIFDFETFNNNFELYIQEPQTEIDKLSTQKSVIQEKIKSLKDDTKKESQFAKFNSDIAEIDSKSSKLETIKKEREKEKENLINELKTFYDDDWELIDKDRIKQHDTKNLFSNSHLVKFKSENVLLRENNKLTALDYLRDIQWD